MKKIIYILSFILVWISCEKPLNIKPTNAIDIETLLSNAKGLNNMVSAAYSGARDVYGKYFFHFAEFLADTGEIVYYGTFYEFEYLQYKDLISTFSFGQSAWSGAYNVINNTNLVIDHLDVVEDEDEAMLIEANARFIRGLLYFDLLRFYGLPYGNTAFTNKSIPLVLKGVKSVDGVTYPERASNKSVLDLVESDLLFAFENLDPEENFFASKYAASAILSRLYLTTEDYGLAAAYADSVIESGIYELHKNYKDAFNHSGNTEEDVFSWQQNNLDNVGQFNEGIVTFYASTNSEGRSDIGIDSYAISTIFDSTDTRGYVQYGVDSDNKIKESFYIGFNETAVEGLICTSKWLDHAANITMVRLAEMYLTRAEANVMLMEQDGTFIPDVSPIEDLKVIQGRAGIDVSTLSTVSIDDVRFERYRELLFEGHRLHDYKRWERSIGEYTFDDQALIIPLPKRETDNNPNLLK